MATAKKHNVAGFDSRDGGMRDAILDAALSFICSTEKDLVLCDEGGDAKREVVAFRMAFAQGAALVLECGWIKGLGRLFLQLLPFVLPINTCLLYTSDAADE